MLVFDISVSHIYLFLTSRKVALYFVRMSQTNMFANAYTIWNTINEIIQIYRRKQRFVTFCESIICAGG